MKELISDGGEGLRDCKSSSQFLSPNDQSRKFDIRDAAGKETYWQLLPQWSRLWIDAIAGVNFASDNGLVQLPEFPLPQF